jgi:hypothetical protein
VARARRAEAEAAAERLMHGRERLVAEAIQARDEARIADLVKVLADVEDTFSWRVTAPIRAIRSALRRRRDGSA